MCLSMFKLLVTVDFPNHDSFLLTFFKGSAHIVGKLMMLHYIPFYSGAPLEFFRAP